VAIDIDEGIRPLFGLEYSPQRNPPAIQDTVERLGLEFAVEMEHECPAWSQRTVGFTGDRGQP
jgi:hypothetical protein